MVEAVLVIPTILLLLIVTHQIYRGYKYACNAALVVRTEMMLESYKINCGDDGTFSPQKHEEALVAMKMFPRSAPGASEETVNIVSGEGGNLGTQLILGLLGGSDKITVSVTLDNPPVMQALLNSGTNISTQSTYTVSGNCDIHAKPELSIRKLLDFFGDDTPAISDE